jgi:hypothetical protein
VKASRIWQVFPWRIASLFAALLGLPIVVIAAWIVWGIDPLQSYYLSAYRHCSERAAHADEATDIRWLRKTAPGRKSEPAIASDVTTGWAGSLSIRLSPSALEDGWAGLDKSGLERIRSSELEELLREYVYDRRPYSDLIAYGIIVGSSFAFVVVLFYGFGMKGELGRECDLLRRELGRGDWNSDGCWEAPPIRQGIGERILVHSRLSKLAEMARSTWANIFVHPNWNRARNKAAKGQDLRNERSSRAVRVQPTESSHILSLESPPFAVTKDPVCTQSIFPGARGGNGSHVQPIVWDKSQWID